MALEWCVCVCMHGATDYTQTEKGERRRRRIEKERERTQDYSGGQVHASFGFTCRPLDRPVSCVTFNVQSILPKRVHWLFRILKKPF